VSPGGSPAADPALRGAVELLDRSLAYTCGALAGVDDSPGGQLGRPTPCARWDLGRLLAHMEDALDAFTEAAAGLVEVHQAAPSGSRVSTLRAKAGALLGTWLVATPARVAVGPTSVAAPLLVATAALEITVHGWDVHRATGTDTPVPDDLAAGLLGLAHAVVGPADRLRRFGPALESPGSLSPGEQLVAFLGRVPPARDGRPRCWEPVGVRAAG
jgi:uncharacterized protein (TIGR03086 family)